MVIKSFNEMLTLFSLRFTFDELGIDLFKTDKLFSTYILVYCKLIFMNFKHIFSVYWEKKLFKM